MASTATQKWSFPSIKSIGPYPLSRSFLISNQFPGHWTGLNGLNHLILVITTPSPPQLFLSKLQRDGYIFINSIYCIDNNINKITFKKIFIVSL